MLYPSRIKHVVNASLVSRQYKVDPPTRGTQGDLRECVVIEKWCGVKQTLIWIIWMDGEIILVKWGPTMIIIYIFTAGMITSRWSSAPTAQLFLDCCMGLWLMGPAVTRPRWYSVQEMPSSEGHDVRARFFSSRLNPPLEWLSIIFCNSISHLGGKLWTI
jgi:hypothetical protein